MMTDGRILAARLVETTGGARILMALLRSSPNYVKGISYDVRLSDKTVRRALGVLLDMKLVRICSSADPNQPHAKEWFTLSPIGKEVAHALVKCNEDMVLLLDHLLRPKEKPRSITP